MIKVSVIVPVYNSEKYLRECLDSLVNQTLKEIEIIVVNDGSTDSSVDIIKEYVDNFPDKIISVNKENGGQASARNLGISMATGEYIGFVDSDDYVDVKMYEAMFAQALDKAADLVECDYKYLLAKEDGSVQGVKKYGNVRPYVDIQDMFKDPLVSPWNKVYKAQILRNNNITFPEGYIYEDTSFFIKAIPYIKTTAFVNEEYVYHFLRENSTMNSKKEVRVGNVFPVLQDIIYEYKNRKMYDKFQNLLEYFCIKILLCSSLMRVAKVTDKVLKKDYIKKTMQMISNEFPNYRKNVLFKKNITGFYMKCINRVTIQWAVFLFGLR